MQEFLQSWGYVGVFVGILLTGLGFPMPEELPIVVGGALAGGFRGGDTDGAVVYVWIMLPVCIIGVVIGDSFLYFIGRFWGTRIVESPFVQKHLLTPEKLTSITENFHKYGIKILLFARLTPGIRAPIFLSAGITRLPLTHFLIADGIYALPGVSLLFFLGYFFAGSAVKIVSDDLGIVKHVIILAVVLGIAGYFTYRFLRRPVVTGSPAEMPKIVEPMSQPLESVTDRILHTPAAKPAPPPIDSPADQSKIVS
ncbi:MAG: DedA family protein [Gemmataceae bacterium]|nr:DedA family protein [Gemmataceae bacterium]